jgi:hypothetical protein
VAQLWHFYKRFNPDALQYVTTHIISAGMDETVLSSKLRARYGEDLACLTDCAGRSSTPACSADTSGPEQASEHCSSQAVAPAWQPAGQRRQQRRQRRRPLA